MLHNLTRLISVGLLLFVTGCATQNNDVPIKDGWRHTLKAPRNYVVKKSDTLYSIAWRYGLDYREVAQLNNLDDLYHIKPGQVLHLISKANKPATRSLQQTTKTTHKVIDTELDEKPTSKIHWVWPSNSHQIINGFAAAKLNKGIDIGGKTGTPVLAAAAGKVVYSGNGLRGYGNLLIIKHNAEFLSAYAHNQKLLVHEGQIVQAGEAIAKMGSTEAKRVILHFEIRKAGKPVDPLQYLPAN